MITTGLNSLDKLDALEESDRKEYEKKNKAGTPVTCFY
jgi:hypothetical protein